MFPAAGLERPGEQIQAWTLTVSPIGCPTSCLPNTPKHIAHSQAVQLRNAAVLFRSGAMVTRRKIRCTMAVVSPLATEPVKWDIRVANHESIRVALYPLFCPAIVLVLHTAIVAGCRCVRIHVLVFAIFAPSNTWRLTELQL